MSPRPKTTIYHHNTTFGDELFLWFFSGVFPGWELKDIGFQTRTSIFFRYFFFKKPFNFFSRISAHEHCPWKGLCEWCPVVWCASLHALPTPRKLNFSDPKNVWRIFNWEGNMMTFELKFLAHSPSNRRIMDIFGKNSVNDDFGSSTFLRLSFTFRRLDPIVTVMSDSKTRRSRTEITLNGV